MTGQTGVRAEHFRGERLGSTLHRRLLRPCRPPYLDYFHVFLLTDGRAVIEFAGESHELTNRAAFSFPANIAPTIALAPGSEALLVGLSPELLIDAIGNKAESVLLRAFAERPAMVTLEPASSGTFAELSALTSGFLKEVMLPGHGSEMAIAAFARLILMTLWRTGDWEAPNLTGHGLDLATLQRFRQLVELHFRDRKPIAFYARSLGLSHDRLHAICTRTLNRTPKALIQQRSIQEASLRLERSASSIQEIASQLGFSDQTYFSHFFKRETGIAPQAYRNAMQKPGNARQAAKSGEYADWP